MHVLYIPLLHPWATTRYTTYHRSLIGITFSSSSNCECSGGNEAHLKFCGSEVIELQHFEPASVGDIASVHARAYVFGLEKARLWIKLENYSANICYCHSTLQ